MYGDDMMGGYEILGYDSLGQVVVAPRGAAPGRQMAPQGFRPNVNQAMRPGRPMMAPMMQPSPLGSPLGSTPPFWRNPIAAPGVMQPFEGLVPLQMQPDLNNGIMTAAVPIITFTGRPQKPYRGQRIVAVVARSAGAAAVQPRISDGVKVGTDLQAASIGDTPLEVFAPTAFGVELVMTPAAPGIDVTIRVTSPVAVPGGETVAISITILGRYIA